jgi:hypothetical protein
MGQCRDMELAIVEHRLDVGLRAANDPQDLARRRLLLERLLRLIEQSRVLDGDDSLVGEGLQQRDLLVREGTNLRSQDQNHADRYGLSNQRDRENRPNPEADRELPAEREFGRLRQVIHVDRAPLDERST